MNAPQPAAAPADPCNCIELTDAALVPHNSRLGLDFSINRETGRVTSTIALVTYLLEKKRGARPISIVATYCPFCGQRYQPEVSDAAK